MVSCIASRIVEDAAHSHIAGAENRKLSVFLATDAAMLRQLFVLRLQTEIQRKSGYSTEVDYFRQELPPAHYFLWAENVARLSQVFFPSSFFYACR